MVFIDDANGLCLYLDPEWTTLTGQPVAEALGRGWLGRVHPDDRTTVAAVLDEARARVVAFSLRFRLLRPDGGSRWVGSAGMPSLGPPARSFLGYFGALTELADAGGDGGGDAGGDALVAYGNVGRFIPPPTHAATAPGDGLDLIADHLLIVKALLDKGGPREALPGVSEALFHVGRALALRAGRRGRLN